MKVLVIGLDGATWDLIKPWVDNGELPTFKRLMEGGTWGKLESTIPPWTIPAWDSMTTGKTPVKLGYATFMVKEGYKFVPYMLKRKSQRLIWDLLSEQDYKTIVVNSPNVYSAHEIRGVMIAGWFNLSKDTLAYPKNVLKEIASSCGQHYVVDIFEVDFDTGSLISGPETDKEYIERCELLFNIHSCTFDHLLNSYEWDFAFLVFVTTDRLQHRFWNEKVLLSHYKKIDKWLSNLLAGLDNETLLLLVSDHGFGPVRYFLNINELFISREYLKLKSNAERGVMNTFFKLIKKLKLLSFARSILKILPRKYRNSLIKKAAPRNITDLDVDWDNTIAFAYEPSGEIYINLKGREPMGVVDPEDYDIIRDEIIHSLNNLEYRGKKLKIRVFKKEEVYPEAKIFDTLPDLIVLPTEDGIQAVDPKVGHGEIITPANGTFGNHRLNGIFLAYGPGIKKGQRIERAKIYDVAPTILHIFGLPIPKDMDGRVLTEIFEEDSEFAKRQPKHVDPSYYEKNKADEKLKKVIKNLKLKGKI